MALGIKYKGLLMKEFHVDTIRYINIQGVDNIEYIQADGHELELIQGVFTYNNKCTIPMPYKRVVRWSGDIAKTVILNLI